MNRKHVIINMGFARSGTTAAHGYFEKHPQVSTPLATKELKFFLKADATARDYATHFGSGTQLFFEASPPYAHSGMERFEEVLERIATLKTQGFDVTLLFLARNFLERAFSHYWHDIGSHHAKFGRLWPIRDHKHPDRFKTLYWNSFLDEITFGQAVNKLLPPAAVMISKAIERFGSDHVRIGFTKDLDRSLTALMEHLGLRDAAPVQTPRITSAAAPSYVFSHGSLKTSQVIVETQSGPCSVTLPGGTCLLFARRHAEVLRAQDYPLARIVAASQTWTRDLPLSCVPEKVLSRLRVQTAAFEKLPEACFLGGCKDRLVADLSRMPENLSMPPQKPAREELDKLLNRMPSP